MPGGDGLEPARVSSVYATRVDVLTAAGPRHGIVRGKALRDATELGGIAVGDWVAVGETVQRSQRAPSSAGVSSDPSTVPSDDPPPSAEAEVVVEAVLPRRTVFMRQAAGERAEPQAIAANIDLVFVVTSAEGDWSERRLERYIVAIKSGGAEAVVLLSKADLPIDHASAAAFAETLAPVLLVSARTGQGVDAVRALIARGTTAALVGSSGVGKSALVNALLGRGEQLEGAVREHDRRGRHTTTKRSLFALANGGLLVDTPGMRELKPWQPGGGTEDEDADVFEDISALAEGCRYRDCRHEGEPGCAVGIAVTDGTLSADRIAAYRKLTTEREALAARQATHAAEQKRRARSAAVGLRKRVREKGR